jgi:hypothetical protein
MVVDREGYCAARYEDVRLELGGVPEVTDDGSEYREVDGPPGGGVDDAAENMDARDMLSFFWSALRCCRCQSLSQDRPWTFVRHEVHVYNSAASLSRRI